MGDWQAKLSAILNLYFRMDQKPTHLIERAAARLTKPFLEPDTVQEPRDVELPRSRGSAVDEAGIKRSSSPQQQKRIGADVLAKAGLVYPILEDLSSPGMAH